MKEPEPPKILAALGDVDSSVGGSAMLELKMRGYPRPNIKWCKDGKPLTVDNSRFKFINPDTETVALIINKVTADDAGKYEAVLTNDLGEAKTEGTLTLSGAPQFMEPIGDQNTAIDDPYKIIAKVTGNPELTWYKDGVPINQDSRLKANKVRVAIKIYAVHITHRLKINPFFLLFICRSTVTRSSSTLPARRPTTTGTGR